MSFEAGDYTIIRRFLYAHLISQEPWGNLIFPQNYIGSKNHLGFTRERVFKQGESSTTIFISKQKCFYPVDQSVRCGLVINMMGTGGGEQALSSLGNWYPIPIHPYAKK